MIPSVWTTAGVWRESASRSVKLWRTCSRVLAMVSWLADNANTVATWQLQFLESVLSKHELFIFQRRTAPVWCAVGIRTLYVLLMSVTRATTSICGKANPALWAFVMERCEPTYSYSYEKTFIKAVFIHRSITVFTRQLEMLAFNYLNISFYSQGKCMKQVQDVIERLWDFIEKLDINTFGKLSVSTVSLSHLKSNEEGNLCVCSQGSSWLITLLAQWWSSHSFSGSRSAFWSIMWWVIF